jgi:hypothetical protein
MHFRKKCVYFENGGKRTGASALTINNYFVSLCEKNMLL